MIASHSVSGKAGTGHERDYWILTAQGLNPKSARLPHGTDPADLLARNDAGVLAEAIRGADLLGNRLIDERLTHLTPDQAALEAASVLAAQPPEHWTAGAEYIAAKTGVPSSLMRTALVGMVHGWNQNPRKAADHQLGRANEVKKRLATPNANQIPASRHEQNNTGPQRPAPGAKRPR